jgi:hypothetical protein
MGERLGLAFDLRLDAGVERMGRQRTGAVARMHAGLLDMLHDARDMHASPSQSASTSTSTAPDEIAVEQHRAVARDTTASRM